MTKVEPFDGKARNIDLVVLDFNSFYYSNK